MQTLVCWHRFTISDGWGKCDPEQGMGHPEWPMTHEPSTHSLLWCDPFSESRSLPVLCQPSFWADWLLLCGAGPSTGLHHCTTTACSECGSTTCHRSIHARSSDINTRSYETYIGCLFGIVSHINCAYLCIWCIQAAAHHCLFSWRPQAHSEHAVPEATQIYRHQLRTAHHPTQVWRTMFFHTPDPKLGMNWLPTELQGWTDHRAFRRKLKTFVFERAFTT